MAGEPRRNLDLPALFRFSISFATTTTTYSGLSSVPLAPLFAHDILDASLHHRRQLAGQPRDPHEQQLPDGFSSVVYPFSACEHHGTTLRLFKD